jgi:prophage regulatory protein
MSAETTLGDGDRLIDSGAPSRVNPGRLGKASRAFLPLTAGQEEVVLQAGCVLATEATWTKWESVTSTRLSYAVALLCFVDPEGISDRKLLAIPFCWLRLQMALAEIAEHRFPILEQQPFRRPPSHKRIDLDFFRGWAERNMLPIPTRFPDPRSRGVRADGKPNRQRRTAASSADFVRLTDLVEGVVPFSRATLWRRVKAKTFPQPVSISAGVTVWRTSEVDEWLKAYKAQPNSTPSETGQSKSQRRKAPG